ncbi:hypothetical protein V2W45_356671 [Cenococcum geophilum]
MRGLEGKGLGSSILSRRLTLASSPQRPCTIFQTRWHFLLVQFLGMLAATFFTIERRRIPMETSGTSRVARWLATHGFFWGLPGGLVPVSGGIFKLLFASGHTPRTPNGWAAFSASKPRCFFKLVAPASHRRNRARLPHKSPPVGVREPGKSAIPMTPKTTGHHARPPQRLAGHVCPSATLPRLGLSPVC